MKILYLLLALICTVSGRRIIGGADVDWEYTFVAAIYKNTPNGTFFCAGSLIEHRWILTARHCVYGADDFNIILGTNNIKSLDPSAVVVTLSSDNAVVHPDFDPASLVHDIALIKLLEDVEDNDYISSVPLTTSNLDDDYYGLQALGWGQTSDDSPGLTDKLQWVLLTSISNEKCKVTYGDQIADTLVCAVGKTNEGICQGDIGGPLISFEGGAPVHQGFVTFMSGNGCEIGDPSGFTRTYPYLEWISVVTSTN